MKFSLEGPDHVPVGNEVSLSNMTLSGGGRPWTWGRDHKWAELDVGEFSVERGDSPVEIKFSMTEIEGLDWKSDLFLDSVVIRPTAVRSKEKLSDP